MINENIFFSLDETHNQSECNQEENIDYSKFLDEINNNNNYLSESELFESMCYEYKIN